MRDPQKRIMIGNHTVTKKEITNETIDSRVINFYRSVYKSLIDRATYLQGFVLSKITLIKSKEEILKLYSVEFIELLYVLLRLFYIATPRFFEIEEINSFDFTFTSDLNHIEGKFNITKRNGNWIIEYNQKKYPVADTNLHTLLNQFYFLTHIKIMEILDSFNCFSELEIRNNEMYILSKCNLCYSYDYILYNIRPLYSLLDSFIEPYSAGSPDAYVKAILEIKRVLTSNQG
jgi:hypothetical protein